MSWQKPVTGSRMPGVRSKEYLAIAIAIVLVGLVLVGRFIHTIP